GLVGAQVVQQGHGGLGRAQHLCAERRIAEQAGEGLHGLGRHALLGNPVGGADEGQVGGQQYGGQQHQQGGQQLAADRQIVQAPLQAHGGFARGLGSGQGSGASGIGQSACAQTPAQILQQGFQPRQGEAEAGTLPAGVIQQIADFGASTRGHVLAHRGAVGGGGLDDPLHLAEQLVGGVRLVAGLQQFGEL